MRQAARLFARTLDGVTENIWLAMPAETRARIDVRSPSPHGQIELGRLAILLSGRLAKVCAASANARWLMKRRRLSPSRAVATLA